MTEIEQKALALLNEVNIERNEKGATFVFVDRSSCVLTEALCRAIEQHEAFKREVSDAVVKATHTMATGKLLEASCILAAFIIAKPDPLVAVMDDFMSMDGGCLEECVEQFRAALAKRGLEVREIEG